MADEENLTPMMIQYRGIKEKYKNEVVFFRLGDFYEMFDSDAVEVSRLLNLTLTHRAKQPMCGIPYHAAKIYIARLLRLGKKIVICEQVGEIPKGGKGIAERKVVEIITPQNVGFTVLVTVIHLNLITQLKIAASRINGFAPHYTAGPVAVIVWTGIIPVHYGITLRHLIISLSRMSIVVVCTLGCSKREPYGKVTPLVIKPLVKLELAVYLVICAVSMA